MKEILAADINWLVTIALVFVVSLAWHVGAWVVRKVLK